MQPYLKSCVLLFRIQNFLIKIMLKVHVFLKPTRIEFVCLYYAQSTHPFPCLPIPINHTHSKILYNSIRVLMSLSLAPKVTSKHLSFLQRRKNRSLNLIRLLY